MICEYLDESRTFGETESFWDKLKQLKLIEDTENYV